MFFTNNELINLYRTDYGVRHAVNRDTCSLINSGRLSLKGYDTYGNALLSSKYKIVKAYKAIKQSIVDRDFRATEYSTSKWLRPWEYIQSLKDFSPPDGDFGVGIEVEMGFRSLESCKFFSRALSKFKYVAIDREGPGTWPIEATFPPVLYSKFNSKCYAMRYLSLLHNNRDMVLNHLPTSHTGTHVNVSVPRGIRENFNSYHLARRLDDLNRFLGRLGSEDKRTYFGRSPYGYGYTRGANEDSFIEWKLFNSTTDPAVLKKYVDRAVALTKLLYSRSAVTASSVLNALQNASKKNNLNTL